MEFEFPKLIGKTDGGIYVATAIISGHQHIRFNKCAIFEFGLSHGEWILLGFNRETKTIAIKRFKEWQPGARKLSIRGNHAMLASRLFIRHYQLPTTRNHYYLKALDEMLVFCLDDTLEGTT